MYRLLKIDHSIDELNKRMFLDDNKEWFFSKETFREKQVRLALRDNARIGKFCEPNGSRKPARPAGGGKRGPPSPLDCRLANLARKRINKQ